MIQELDSNDRQSALLPFRLGARAKIVLSESYQLNGLLILEQKGAEWVGVFQLEEDFYFDPEDPLKFITETTPPLFIAAHKIVPKLGPRSLISHLHFVVGPVAKEKAS